MNDTMGAVQAGRCVSCHQAGGVVDLRPGDDVCLDCQARECERCGMAIPLDEDVLVDDGRGRMDVACEACAVVLRAETVQRFS